MRSLHRFSLIPRPGARQRAVPAAAAGAGAAASKARPADRARLSVGTRPVGAVVQWPAQAGRAAARAHGGARRSTWRTTATSLLVLTSALGFLLCVVANALNRATLPHATMLFWGGVVLIVAPIVHQLSGRDLTTGHRLSLVSLLGMALYAVKLARDPLGFSYPDELIHAYNVLNILRHDTLFLDNPILPATPFYPGLEATTAALGKVTGLGVFGAGVIVVGAARLIMVLALFLLFRLISGSARAAGIGVAVYTCSANFLFFSAQFSYESLSLPLMVVVLFCVAAWGRLPVRAWWVPAVLVTATVVMTHHLSSYALLSALTVLAVIHLVMQRRAGTLGRNPWPFALLTAALITVWVVVVGSAVVGYLAPVFTRAFKGALDTLNGSQAPRRLFGNRTVTQTAQATTPIGERLISFATVPVIAIGVAFGLREVWRRHRRDPWAILLALAAVAYFGTLGLRLSSSTWEIGNRASGYVFIGLGFVIGCARIERWTFRGRRVGRLVLTAGVTFSFVGGFITGWPASTRLALPQTVEVDGAKIDSQTLGMARWVDTFLPDRRMAAAESDARMLLTYGHATAVAGSFPDVRDVVGLPKMDPWMLRLLRANRLRYVVADRRQRGISPDIGPFFAIRPPVGEVEALLPPGVVDKFEKAGGTRLFDDGHIVIFDMQGRRR